MRKKVAHLGRVLAKSDVVALQEVHGSFWDLKRALNMFMGEWILHFNAGSAHGTGGVAGPSEARLSTDAEGICNFFPKPTSADAFPRRVGDTDAVVDPPHFPTTVVSIKDKSGSLSQMRTVVVTNFTIELYDGIDLSNFSKGNRPFLFSLSLFATIELSMFNSAVLFSPVDILAQFSTLFSHFSPLAVLAAMS